MLVSLIALSVVVAGWALGAKRLERWRVTAPMILVLAGVAVGFPLRGGLESSLDAEFVESIAEIILAVLLFLDATDVRGGLFGTERRAAIRLLFVAMPLSLMASVLLGEWLLPGLDWAVLLVIACVVVPIDFAPAASILRDGRVPERIRNALKVEGGYNDGIVSPVFIFALVLAGDESRGATPLQALSSALPQSIKAIAVGLVVGALLSVAANAAERRDLMTDQSKRLILVTAPLLSYGLSVAIAGSGFVAAFVCGIALNYLRRSPSFRRDLELVDDVGALLTAAMWFVFGAVTVLALSAGVPVGTLVFCLMALTLVRMVPILAALIGTGFSWRERLLIGWLGPRGTTSIVFGLLAFNVLAGDAADQALLATVVVVLGSVVLHGIGAPAAAHARGHSQTRLTA